MKPAEPFRIVAAEIERTQRPSFLERRTAAEQNLLLLAQIRVGALFRIPFQALEAALDDARSARMTSSSMVRTSRAGSIVPDGCGTAGSRNMRTTWSSASALRNGATSRSAAAPVFAPPTPAMSANSTVAGTCLRGLKSAVSLSSRSSGPRAPPTFASDFPAARRFARARQQLKQRRLSRRRKSDQTGTKHLWSSGPVDRFSGHSLRHHTARALSPGGPSELQRVPAS